MTKTITRDDVLRYIFNETSEEENLAIEKQLIVNSSLMDYYKLSCETVNEVRKVEIEPSDKVTDNILNFSDALRFESIS